LGSLFYIESGGRAIISQNGLQLKRVETQS
jgi:hypothetical protein